MRIIITRPVEDAESLAAGLRAQGHEPLIHPLLEIAFPTLAPIPLDGVAALIATSRNALKGLAANAAFDAARALPVYCVGEATAAFARQLGFSQIRVGAGTAKELLSVIAAATDPGSGALLYLTGEQLAFDLQAALTTQGYAVRRVTVYEAREASPASARALAAKLTQGQADAVILMSPRTASIFARALALIAAPSVACFCLSEAVAARLGGFPDLTIRVAKRPTEPDLLQLTAPAAE